MKERHATLFVFVGGWLSLIALTIGGSVLLPPARSASDASTALLYRFAGGADVSSYDRTPSDLGRSLIVDLDTMQLALYEEGTLVKLFPVLSKGKPGTPWETPTGNYAIQAREIKHRSSIGGTWMPYSMQFYGNFFIHGWPTYDDGRSVPVGYSGGCIRLSTSDAKEVYEFVPKGARVIVIGNNSASSIASTSQYYLHGDGVLPDISARSFIIEDVESGHVLWEKNSSTPIQPRGLTAMMTALTAVETVNQYKIVRMSELLLGKSVLRKYSIGAIDEMPAGVLVYPLLFGPNDTVAKVFAAEHGSAQFVRYMNEKSHAIGMSDTRFGGPLSSDESTSTARDLAALLSYVKYNKNFLIDVTLAEEKTLRDSAGDTRFDWENRNPWMVNKDGMFRGGIADVSDTAAGNAMLFFDIPVSEFSSRTIAFVVLNSDHLEDDVRALRNFIAENFVYGVEGGDAIFIREKDEPTPGLLQKAKQLIDLEGWLRDNESPSHRA